MTIPSDLDGCRVASPVHKGDPVMLDIERRLAALEAGLSRRDPIAGSDYGRGRTRDLQDFDKHVGEAMGTPDTRGDSATRYARQPMEWDRVALRKGPVTINVRAAPGTVQSLVLDGWLPA